MSPNDKPIEPNELDKAIVKHFPDASLDARMTIRARAEKQHKRHIDQLEHRNRPSILVSFENSPTLDHLTALREVVMVGLRAGNLDADRRTVEKWEDAMWSRLLYFLATAPTISEATFVINHSLTWPKPAHVQTLLDALAVKKYASLP